MSLEASFCIRRDDTEGKDIKTFLDALGTHIQAVILVDEDGNPSAIAGNPLFVTGPIEVEQSDSDDLNCNANLQIGNADVDASNPIPVEIEEAVPTDPSQLNASLALTYVMGDLTQIAATIDTTIYTKTLTYVVGDLSTISAWV